MVDAYIQLATGEVRSFSQREIADGVILDLDASGNAIGVEVLSATSVKVDGKRAEGD